jgi:hypothetical protein
LLEETGFAKGAAGRWMLNVSEYEPKRTFIEER